MERFGSTVLPMIRKGLAEPTGARVAAVA
jgi:hypothetical protein